VRLAHAFEIIEVWEAVLASHDVHMQVVTLRGKTGGRSGAGTATCKREQSVSPDAAPSAAHDILQRASP
jgi:hypothetical protein